MEQSEEITDIVHTELKDNFILSSSIDGTLGVYDIRQKKIFALSDCLEEEITSLEIVKNSNNILASTNEGYIEIFNWGWFGDFKDRIKGHPQSVLCMDKYDENLIISGCEDGGVRICSVYPKGVRGIICDKDKVNIPNELFNEVNCVCISKDKCFICSCCNISFVKIYDCRNVDFSKIYTNLREEDFEESLNSKNENKSDFDSESDDDEKENEDNEIESNDEDLVSEEDKESDDNNNKEGSDNDNKKKGNNINKKKIKDNKKEDKGNIKLIKRKINENDIPDISEEIIEDEENEEDDENEEDEENVEDEDDEKEDNNINENMEKLNNDINLIESENGEKNNDKDESSDDDSSMSSDSSKKKKKSKKIKTLGKKRKSNNLIETERRKAFFNDL